MSGENKLIFTLVSGDENHKTEITKGITRIPIKTSINHYDDCESFTNFLESIKVTSYHVVLLDMDDPENVGMECLKTLRGDIAYSDVVVICYMRVEDKTTVEQIFVEGGNIVFIYPKTREKFHEVLMELVKINWQIYTTGTSIRNLILKL